MVLLATLVLSRDGQQIAPVGRFLHAPEHPFRWTLDATGREAVIVGAALRNADELHDPLLGVLIANRERHPLIGAASTRLWSLDRTDASAWGGADRWVRLDALAVGEAIRVPEQAVGTNGDTQLVVSWARVRRITSAPPPDRVWPGTPHLVGTLKLQAAYSYATPAGFVHT